MKTLPVKQQTFFLREAKDSRVFEMYYVKLVTGLRRGKLLGLKWEDIDLERSNLRVKRQIARVNGEVAEAPLKTKNAYRTLPLAGQCPAYAPPGAGAGGTSKVPLPRSAARLCNPGSSKRG